ncbi:hypothetical protein PRZ48_008625 [Zasmidium cellare]|uniref:F-box domain-containing protein n=1 Tax=Zasmidium cellare TaxID=395010 RepID=A0ABR0EGR7_ZASCE|nr:hypothetical protein PRZ48_008625 [Zasmidium cellare]
MAIPSLPTEIWLEVFRYVDPADIWLSLQHVSKEFHACARDTMQAEVVPNFLISLSFTLGSGTRARWYDIRGSITLGFSSMSKHNPQYALFDKVHLLPESCSQRAWEKWNQICSAGVGESLDWRVALKDGPVRTVKMSKLIISHKHGAWCDWREMLDAYFKFPHVPARNPVWQRDLV